jgi:SAM-dependent methyltransferase
MLADNDQLTLEEFARCIGATPDDIPGNIQDLIAQTDLRYRRLSTQERDAVMLSILKKLEADEFVRVGRERKGIWEKAWSASAKSFQERPTLEGLLPEYHTRTRQVVRLNREYVQSVETGNLENSFSQVFRRWLFQKYLGSAGTIYEFGCGSGFNLAILAQMYPDKKLHGLDWAESAVQLVNQIGQTQGWRVQGRMFDFFAPDPSLTLEDNSAVLTLCALEQIGDKHENFLWFLLDRSPALCLNMEPLCELYDPDNLVDYMAYRYHKQRGYLDGYLTRLRQLEAEGRIEILKTQRVTFGNLYHEGYSFIAWRPN